MKLRGVLMMFMFFEYFGDCFLRTFYFFRDLSLSKMEIVAKCDDLYSLTFRESAEMHFSTYQQLDKT